MLRSNGASIAEIYCAALLCAGCDVAAARKVCGFTGHRSCKGCSKCTKAFPGCDPCPPRHNHSHREEAQEILNQTTAGDRASVEEKYETRYSELMLLPSFDCVRFHIIDPMNNLFIGTAKHDMKNIWLDGEMPKINKNDFSNIQQKFGRCWQNTQEGCEQLWRIYSRPMEILQHTILDLCLGQPFTRTRLRTLA